jgi:hypothetical protein
MGLKPMPDDVNAELGYVRVTTDDPNGTSHTELVAPDPEFQASVEKTLFDLSQKWRSEGK